MVNRFFLIFLWSPLFLFSGTFTASLNRNQVGLGESFTLTLTLKDDSAKTPPQIESLKKYFLIHSQQQASNTTIINGKMTSSYSWKYVLVPKAEGEMIIPSLSIETSDDILSTQPASIRVVKAIANRSEGQSNSNETLVSTFVSNRKPYKNEPFFYTVRLTSKQPLVNIQMHKPNIENAIVEIAGEPKTFGKIETGLSEGVVEFNYIITPIKNGQLKIPSSMVQGAIPAKRTLSSFFNDAIDLGDFMQGFEQWKPFALATEETIVDVQPAIADVSPWLPAKSLMIEEIWDEKQPLQAGELFTRGFHIVAEGVNANQLPALNDKQVGDDSLKMYADKPELSTEVSDGMIKSIRKEQYTLIPQQEGKMVLPEITIAWWDIEHKIKVVSTIPTRTIHVLPAAKKPVVNKPAVAEEVLFKEINPIVKESEKENFLLYAIIGGLGCLLALIMGWGIWLQKKMNRLLNPVKELKLKESAEQKKSPIKVKITEEISQKTKKEELNDLNPT